MSSPSTEPMKEDAPDGAQANGVSDSNHDTRENINAEPSVTKEMTTEPSELHSESKDSSKPESRLLLISNRLPITIKRSDEGKYDMSMSSGGLVSGLSGLSKSTKFQWYGWPGLEVPDDEIGKLKTQLKDEYDAVPVMLDDELADRHYNGFSSKSTLRLASHHELTHQTPSCGLSSITTLEKSPLTNLLGTHIQKPTASSHGQSPKTFKTMTLSGSMITT